MKDICLCGPDGVGKSTQIRLIKEYCEKRGRTIKIIHLFSSSSTILSSFHQKPGVRFLLTRVREMKEHRIGLLLKNLLRVIHVILDSWISRISWRRTKKKKTIYIFDRYFYDILVLIGKEERSKVFEKLVFAAAHLVPKPQVALFLVAEPGIIAERKQELDKKEIEKLLEWYRKIGGRVGAVFINATSSEEEVFKEIKKHLKDSFFCND